MNGDRGNMTCETCDWYCYGTWPSNTCDKWERTVFESDVPDEAIGKLLKVPTESDIAALRDEIDRLESDGENDVE